LSAAVTGQRAVKPVSKVEGNLVWGKHGKLVTKRNFTVSTEQGAKNNSTPDVNLGSCNCFKQITNNFVSGFSSFYQDRSNDHVPQRVRTKSQKQTFRTKAKLLTCSSESVGFASTRAISQRSTQRLKPCQAKHKNSLLNGRVVLFGETQ